MSGWYAMKRGWMEHEIFVSQAPYTRREAWVWIVESACFKPTEIDVGGKPYTVPRGALCYSERFLSAKWRWSKTAVRTFLRHLEAHGIVACSVIKTGTGTRAKRNQISLCNYDKYQVGETKKQPKQNQNETKEEQGNKDYTLEANASNGADAPSTIEVSVLSKAVWDAGKAYLSSHGVANPGAVIGRWLKTHPPIDVLAAVGASQKSGTKDPVPYITEALKGKPNGKSGKAQDRLNAFIAGARGTS